MSLDKSSSTREDFSGINSITANESMGRDELSIRMSTNEC